MLPIPVNAVKNSPIFHIDTVLDFFLGRPKILRMDAKAISTQLPKLPNRMRAQVRLRHYSIRTEQSYVDWARWFILFHNKRHPEKMGAEKVQDFLSLLAVALQIR